MHVLWILQLLIITNWIETLLMALSLFYLWCMTLWPAAIFIDFLLHCRSKQRHILVKLRAANERNMRGPGVTSHKREIQQTRKKRQKILLAKPISPKCMKRKTSFLQRFCHLLAARVSTEALLVANDGWRRTNWVGHLGRWQRHFFPFLGAEKLWICNILWNQRSVREHLFLISRTPQ